MHGGSVTAESKGKDHGTTFTVVLPLVQVPRIAADSRSHSHSAVVPQNRKKRTGSPLNGHRILLVEDDHGAREALTEVLVLAGAEVRAAASGSEAIKALEEFFPDQMVLDISMPLENGYSLLKRIRQLPAFSGKLIPALALTALATNRDREEAFTAGFQMHLTKPVDIDRLTLALIELKNYRID